MESSKTVTTLGIPSICNLDGYLKHISKYERLSAEEEHELAIKVRDENCMIATRRIIMAHLRYVAHVARGFSGYKFPLDELIQEGNVGLLKAVKRFNPDGGVRFISFAVYWIKAEINEFILKNFHILKIATTKAQRKLFFNLRGMRNKYDFLGDKEAEEIAHKLNVPLEQVKEMDYRFSNTPTSLDKPMQSLHDDDGSTMLDFLVGNEPNEIEEFVEESEEQLRSRKLTEAMSKLSERSKDIITKRFFHDEPPTLKQLAGFYNLSIERVRQLEKNAIRDIKKYIVLA